MSRNRLHPVRPPFCLASLLLLTALTVSGCATAMLNTSPQSANGDSGITLAIAQLPDVPAFDDVMGTGVTEDPTATSEETVIADPTPTTVQHVPDAELTAEQATAETPISALTEVLGQANDPVAPQTDAAAQLTEPSETGSPATPATTDAAGSNESVGETADLTTDVTNTDPSENSDAVNIIPAETITDTQTEADSPALNTKNTNPADSPADNDRADSTSVEVVATDTAAIAADSGPADKGDAASNSTAEAATETALTTEPTATAVDENSSVIAPGAIHTPETASLAMSPPKAFAWNPEGRSTGQRPYRVCRSGDGALRVLIIGSLSGHDPISERMVNSLANRLHSDALILGGFQTTIVETGNPDGKSEKTFLNSAGQYVNRHFPGSITGTVEQKCTEVTFLLNLVDTFRPDRVIHIRTVPGHGVVGATDNAVTIARRIAAELQLAVYNYPQMIRKGSLEYCLAVSTPVEVLTLAIPNTIASDAEYSRWEVCLLSLLQSDAAVEQAADDAVTAGGSARR